ncbi:MAG: glycosyltransferase family 39 protein [Saprospiraceae bacterium]|nr:glycosyltransferase family 39 protein [Saprospiraceae bacterium]
MILALAFAIRIYGIIVLSLGVWDERFHALVAKNMMFNPLTPVLINDGLISLDSNDWSLNEIWLSKPPLTFWIISLSLKVFGINELGLRFPSLIFSLISVYLAFLIGKKLYNEKVGLIAAFFYAINGMLYEINIGLFSGDHVDTLFHLLLQSAVYITISYSKNFIRTGVLIGLLTGLAFLCKWIMAFFILIICLSYFIYINRNLKDILKYILTSNITMTFIILPWMIWINYSFPEETAAMMQGIINPITTVVQEHSGPWYYYLNSIRININELIYLPLIFLIYKSRIRITKEKFLLLVWIFIPLILLSISSTKREVYIILSAMPFFILISLFIQYLDKIFYNHKYRKIAVFIQVLFFIAAARYSIERIKPFKPRLKKPEYRIEMEKLIASHNISSDSIVLFNEPNYIDARFYYNLIGYRYLNDSTINSIKSKGYKVFENQAGIYTER